MANWSVITLTGTGMSWWICSIAAKLESLSCCIVERRYVFSLFRAEKHRLLLAVLDGRVADTCRTVRMFGNKSESAGDMASVEGGRGPRGGAWSTPP